MTKETFVTIGVLALQGAFIEHENHLKLALSKLQLSGENKLIQVPVNIIQVRTPEELEKCDALIIPGGESTAISLVAERTGLLGPLRDFVKIQKKPVWGTCAGMILLAEQATRTKKDGQELIGGLNIRVRRNHFGRQTESFAQKLALPVVGKEPFECVFIRAPVVETILEGELKTNTADELVSAPASNVNDEEKDGNRVKVLGWLPGKDGQEDIVVAVQQHNIVGTSFHPELTNDSRLHEWWITEVLKKTVE
jgi:pyridoxal 5'-phosphate synthase pdxT subunit